MIVFQVMSRLVGLEMEPRLLPGPVGQNGGSGPWWELRVGVSPPRTLLLRVVHHIRHGRHGPVGHPLSRPQEAPGRPQPHVLPPRHEGNRPLVRKHRGLKCQHKKRLEVILELVVFLYRQLTNLLETKSSFEGRLKSVRRCFQFIAG